MPVPLKDVLAKMTPDQRARVEADANKMIEEEMERARTGYMEKFDAISAAVEAEGLAVTLEVQQIIEIALNTLAKLEQEST